jgi:hypothetical protein
MVAGGFVRSHGLIRHVAAPALDAIVYAQRTHRSQRFVVKGRHAQSRAQFFVKLPQIGELLRLRWQLDSIIGEQEFLVARVPQPGELTLGHDAGKNSHLEAGVGVLPELRAASILLDAHYSPRASDGKSQRRQAVHLLLHKSLVDIPHSLFSLNNLPVRVKLDALQVVDQFPICRYSGVGNFAGSGPKSQRSPYFWFEPDVPFKITGTEPLGVS